MPTGKIKDSFTPSLRSRVPAVGNPLSMVAVFAALAEVCATLVLTHIPAPEQKVFIWFVMLYPTLLLILFFATLHLRPLVLFSPMDVHEKHQGEFIRQISNTPSPVKRGRRPSLKAADAPDSTHFDSEPEPIRGKRSSSKEKKSLEEQPEEDTESREN